jgi:hypothetical protein
LLLLDSPLKEPPADISPKPANQAMALLGQVAALALEGRVRRPDDRGPIRVPLPLHARELVSRLLGQGTPFRSAAELSGALDASRDDAVEVTGLRRRSQLAILGAFLIPGLYALLIAGPAAGVNFANWTEALEPLELRRCHRQLELRASADLASGLLSPAVPVRLKAILQWQSDQQTLDALRDLERQFVQNGAAMRQGMGRVTRTLAEQLGRDMQANAGVIDGELPAREDGLTYAREYAKVCRTADPRQVYPPQVLTLAACVLGLFPVLWAVWAWLTRGGLSLWLSGLTLVRRDGARAGRFRCAWRTLLVWTPVAAMVWLSFALDVRCWTEIGDPGRAHPILPWLSWAAWWAGAALLPLWLVLALRFPRRGLHDWLAGTYVVPR